MKNIIVASILMFTSGFAVAGHCPADAKAIDTGLEKVTLSDEVRAQVVALRDKGMSLHDSGDHAASEDVMAEAMRLLLSNIQ